MGATLQFSHRRRTLEGMEIFFDKLCLVDLDDMVGTLRIKGFENYFRDVAGQDGGLVTEQLKVDTDITKMFEHGVIGKDDATRMTHIYVEKLAR